MNATYHFSSAQEFNKDILEAIKLAFKSKPITITIEEEMDTTDYLLSNIENKKMIDRSLKEAKNGKFIELNAADL